jgi:hypothetical protein
MVCGYLRKKISEIRLSSSVRDHHSNSIDWTLRSSARVDPVTTDVVAPSPWTIFGCQNGLRLFKEAKERDSLGRVGIFFTLNLLKRYFGFIEGNHVLMILLHDFTVG